MKLLLEKNNKVISASGTGVKKQIRLAGSLANILKPGKSALYLYQGNLIRTSAVKAILEASAEHVSFETQEYVYTITYDTHSDTKNMIRAIA